MIQNTIIKSFKVLKLMRVLLFRLVSKFICMFKFYINGVKIDSFTCLGLPYIHLSLNASCEIGSNFKMNNGTQYSDSGVNGKCRIEVRDSARLLIGDNVGMSDVTITCHKNITIGNNVLLGVGCQIRDTDNHSLNANDRLIGLDWKNKKNASIKIGNNVFIGAYSFILKGVKIGSNSIIGAGSVVTKEVPKNEIWAGNPAKFIKKNS